MSDGEQHRTLAKRFGAQMPVSLLQLTYSGAKALFPSAESMHSNAQFRALLRSWIKVAKLDNMHVERLLALIKRASALAGDAVPFAERLCSAGFLSQLIASWRAVTGTTPGVRTRKSLLNASVPLACRAKSKKDAVVAKAVAFLSSIEHRESKSGPR